MTDLTSGDGRLTRRDLLRWAGIAGAATVVPLGLSSCVPVTTPMPLAPDPSVRARGFVGGTDTVLGQGGWCWFQSPRTSMGSNGVLWLGSTVGRTATEAEGTIQAWAFNSRNRSVIRRIDVARSNQDDHTSPGVLALGNRAQVSWALHRRVDFLDVGDARTTGAFTPQRIRRAGATTSPGRGMAYTSSHVVKGQRWLLYRGEQFSWNLLVSTDDGKTWTAKGLVVTPGTSGDRPYLHAASDGTRLHILVTDGNPTEFLGTSVYAGTVESDLTIRRADKTKVGSVGSGAPKPARLTRLAAGTPGPDETDDTDLWLSDLCIVDNRPTGVLSLRDSWPADAQAVNRYRHRYLWIRQRPSGWTVEHLCWAGSELCPSQPDYSGLAAQDPSDPTRVVVSTNVHPVTAEPLVSAADGKVHFELFEAKRVGEGAWTFTPITQHSVEDNIRPSIAAGGPDKTLSWMRGTYWSWISFDTRIVVRRSVAPATSADPSPTTTTTPPPVTTTTADPGTTTTTGPPELGYYPD